MLARTYLLVAALSTILLSSLLLTAGCSSNNKGYPDWYLNPPKNDSAYLYGVGEGYDLDSAVQSALKNLSSKIMVTISAKTELLKEDNLYGYNVESKQKIEEEITGLTFNNYEVSKIERKDNSKVFALVAVDRVQFMKDKMGRLDTLDTQMRELDRESSGKSILEKRMNLLEVSILADKAKTLSYLLAGLDEYFDAKRRIDNYIAYDLKYRKINDQMVVYIQSSGSFNRMFAEVIQNALNDEGISVTKSNNSNDENLVKISVNTNSAHQEVYGSNMAKVKVYIATMSNKGKIIGSNQLEVSGSSVIDNRQADIAAVKAFENEVKKQGIIKIIGLQH